MVSTDSHRLRIVDYAYYAILSTVRTWYALERGTAAHFAVVTTSTGDGGALSLPRLLCMNCTFHQRSSLTRETQLSQFEIMNCTKG